MRLFRAAEAIACASSQRGEALERIITHVGASARRRREISARDIELFTEMTGDRTPIHYDDDLAGGRSRFGGIVVQGGVTSGLLNAVVAEDLPGPGSVFLHVAWRFVVAAAAS